MCKKIATTFELLMVPDRPPCLRKLQILLGFCSSMQLLPSGFVVTHLTYGFGTGLWNFFNASECRKELTVLDTHSSALRVDSYY